MPTLVVTADDKQAEREIARLQQTIGKLSNRLDQVNRKTERVGKTTKSAFSKSAVMPLIGALTGATGLAGALRMVTSAFDDMKQRRREAAAEAMPLEGPLKQFAQISGGDPAEMKRLKQMSANLVRRHGFTDPAAMGLVFSAVSQGFTEEQIRTFGELKGITTDVPATVKAVAGLKAAFGEDVGGGTIRSIVNSLMAAAAPSEAGLEQIAPQMLVPAQLVRATGGTMEETAAALGKMVKGTKSFERAATQLAAVGRMLEKHDALRGIGIFAGVEKLAAMPEAQRRKILVDSEAKQGYGVLLELLEEIREVQADIFRAQAETGTPESRINQALRVSAADPTIQAITIAQRARGARIAAERAVLGEPELRIQAVQELLRERLTLGGAGVMAQKLSLEFLDKASKYIDSPERIVELAAGMYTAAMPPRRDEGAGREPFVIPGEPQVMRFPGLRGMVGEIEGASYGGPGSTMTRAEEFTRAADALLQSAEALQSAAEGMKGPTALVPATLDQ